MILDNRCLFSDSQAITVDAASTSSYDLGVPGKTWPYGLQLSRKMGGGQKIPLLVQVTEAFTTGNGMTDVEIVLQSDEDSAFGSAKNVFSVTVPIADLVKGYICPIEYLPRNITERYLRFYYNVIGGTASAGKITSGFVGAVDNSYQG